MREGAAGPCYTRWALHSGLRSRQRDRGGVRRHWWRGGVVRTGGMYAGRRCAGLAENGLAGQPVAGDELTGLAAVASHAAATDAHTRSNCQHQLHHLHHEQHLAQHHQLNTGYRQAAMQLDSRMKDLIHANMPGNMSIPPSMMGGRVPVMEEGSVAKLEGKCDLPQSRTRKRRQSQARLVQNAEAQKRYRYVQSHVTPARPCRWRSSPRFSCTRCHSSDLRCCA